MNCAEAYQTLEMSLAGPVEATRLAAARDHALRCPDCRARLGATQALRGVLGRLDRPDREEIDAARARVFKALHQDEARRKRRMPRFMAAAAVLALVGASSLGGWWALDSGSPEVSLAAYSSGEVGLLLESKRELKGARITLEPPDQVEFRDYPGSRSLTFETDLASGRNYLEIPVTTRGGQGGCLKARIEHEMRSSEVCVEIRVGTRSAEPRASDRPTVSGPEVS